MNEDELLKEWYNSNPWSEKYPFEQLTDEDRKHYRETYAFTGYRLQVAAHQLRLAIEQKWQELWTTKN